MSLTKQDLKGIKGVVGEVLEENFPQLFEKAIEPLAQAIQKDFKKVDERFNKIDEKLLKIDDDINYVHSHLSLIEEKLDKKVDKEVAHSLDSRVRKLEARL